MTNHSEPAREAVALLFDELRCRMLTCDIPQGEHPIHTFDRCVTAVLAASPAPAASGGLEAVREAASEFHRATQYRLNLFSEAGIQGRSAIELIRAQKEAVSDYRRAETDLLAALAAPAATGGEARGRVLKQAQELRNLLAARADVNGPLTIAVMDDIIAALYAHPAPSETGASGEAVGWVGDISLEYLKAGKEAKIHPMPFPHAVAVYTHPATSETGASVGVKVRALDWSPDGVIAETPFGVYSVGQTYDDKWTWTRSEYPYGDTSDPLPTEAEAKAAAQADYETRIRAALEGRSDG